MRCLYPQAAENIDVAEYYAISGQLLANRRWHLRANMVSSVDGAANLDGKTLDLTTPVDQMVFRLLRDLADVILIGSRTAQIDPYPPPPPTAVRKARRLANGMHPLPRLAIVSGLLDLDVHGSIFSASREPPIVITHDGAPKDRLSLVNQVADVIVAGQDSVDLTKALERLADNGLHRILCEGGPTLLSRLFAAQLVDELCLTISPLVTNDKAVRIVSGSYDTGVQRLQLAHILEDQGTVLFRYVVKQEDH